MFLSYKAIFKYVGALKTLHAAIILMYGCDTHNDSLDEVQFQLQKCFECCSSYRIKSHLRHLYLVYSYL